MLTLSNLIQIGNNVVQPLHWNPAIMFRRARIVAGGQVIEDIDDFNRLSLMVTALKSQDDQKEIAMEGFGLFGIQYDVTSSVSDDGLSSEAVADADARGIYRNRDFYEAGPYFDPGQFF